MTAKEGKRWGFYNALFDRDVLMEEVRALASMLDIILLFGCLAQLALAAALRVAWPGAQRSRRGRALGAVRTREAANCCEAPLKRGETVLVVQFTPLPRR